MLDASDRAKLVSLRASPAVTASSLSVARRGNLGADAAITAAQSVQVALGDEQPPHRCDDARFDPSLSVADIDLQLLTRQLADQGERRWSILLSGPPGTGKSAYARHVAAACGIEVIEKRASDLLSMFVGGTEAAIAAAFSHAQAANALLIIDEVDSLLRDRRSATTRWEVSIVNELLGWMDVHPLPIVVTTNFDEALDIAATRRFLFKIRFSSLDAKRARQLFQANFGLEPSDALDRIEGLVPSDFALVNRRVQIMGKAEQKDIKSMLSQEVQARSSPRNTIGF